MHIRLAFLIASISYYSLPATQENLRTATAHEEIPLLQVEEIRRAAQLHAVAQIYAGILGQLKTKEITPLLAFSIRLFKNEFLTFFHAAIHNDIHPQLRQILLATNIIMQTRINRAFYELFEKQALKLQNDAQKHLSIEKKLRWKRRYKKLGNTFMKVIVPDTISQEVKDLYLDFLLDTYRIYQKKQIRRPGF